MTDRRLKLVLIITGLNTGGAEMMLLKLLERLDARFSPHVISLTNLGDIGPRLRGLGIPVDALNMRVGIPDLRPFIRLVRMLRNLRPDLVHTWMYHADLLGGIAARLAGIRALGWCIRNSNLDPDQVKLSTRLVVTACARLSHFVPKQILTCSDVARQVHVAHGYASDKMVVVPNGFDLARFQPDGMARVTLRSELGIPPGTPLVGLIGRFDPQKNHLGFVHAAALLYRQWPSVRFVLAGHSVDSRNLTLVAAVRDAGISDAVHLLGLREDVPRLMAALDVLVCSSYGEAFPNVVGEAMACGTPCVVTDVGDCAQIVGDTGRVVPPGDMDRLATAVKDLLAMPESARRALGAQARARVSERFEIGKIVKLYEVFFDRLASQGGPELGGASWPR